MTTIAGKTVVEWVEFARRDDCLDHMVPSDLRLLVGEIWRLRHQLTLAQGDLSTIAAEPLGDETSDKLVAVYRDIAKVAERRYLDAHHAAKG
jgi:hypothetical protein